MVKQIIWSKRALKERLEILEYWNKRNRSNAYSKKLDLLFVEKIEFLSIHPLIGKKTDIQTIRIKVVRDYLIFYEIHASEIHILSIKDGRQNPLKLKDLF